MSNPLHLPQGRYIVALERQRDRIANGLSFSVVDSDATGAKYTYASWGLCSEDVAAWPDAEDHLWPEQFLDHNRRRVAPKYRGDHQPCPMQTNGGGSGCFYSCRIFKGNLRAKDRSKAVDLYDAAIRKAADE